MIRRSLAVVPGLATGAALAGAIYWTFLNTPDSNLAMLAASAALIVIWIFVLAVTVNGAVLMAGGASVREALGLATHGVGWFLIAAAPLAVGWWLLRRADTWVVEHSGEISAWIIAHTGRADITRLLTAEIWISRWLRWAILPMASVSLLAALLIRGRERPSWVRRTCHWQTLLVGTLVFVFFLVLPWQLAGWRPGLPQSWAQPAVAALRLGAVFLLGVTGAAVLIVAAVEGPRHGRRGAGLRSGRGPLA